MAGKDEETSLEDSSFGPGHFKLFYFFPNEFPRWQRPGYL